MPFALVFIGILLIVTGAKNTYKEFGAELIEDFTGEGNFTWWIVSIGAIGALGYIKELQSFSRLFLVLIVTAMLISNRGVFAKLTGALQSGPTHPTPETTNTAQTTNTANGIPIPASTNADAQANFGKVLEAAKNIIPLFL